MTNFVGDNDHGDALPPSEVLFKEILELRKQRDEARREVCDIHHLTGFLGGDYANSRGWDCYPNGECKFSQSAKDFEVFLNGQGKIMSEINERLRKERDEARQMYCKLWELPWRTGGIKKAKELGWDCFKDGDIQRQKILDEITSAEKIKNDALDRLAKLDEELGLL